MGASAQDPVVEGRVEVLGPVMLRSQRLDRLHEGAVGGLAQRQFRLRACMGVEPAVVSCELGRLKDEIGEQLMVWFHLRAQNEEQAGVSPKSCAKKFSTPGRAGKLSASHLM